MPKLNFDILKPNSRKQKIQSHISRTVREGIDPKLLLLKHKKKLLRSFMILGIVMISAMLAFPEVRSVYVTASAASKRKIPIYCVESESPKVSISFDAAWGADDTDELLRILRENDVKTTFFLCGYWIDKYPEEVKRIFAEGHDIANHGDTHAHGAQLSLTQNQKEIMGVHEKVKNLLGVEMNLFRPPYGEYNNTVIEAADSLNYYTIQWDVEGIDIKANE